MKRHFVILAFLLSVSFFAAAEKGSVRVGLLNGPSCVPCVQLIEKSRYCTFTQFADPQALLPKMLKNEVDVGFLPVNVAAKVYNSSNKALVLCAVTGNGNIKLITSDASVRRLENLAGKTVYVAGQGATPDYLTRYLLEKNDIAYYDNQAAASEKLPSSVELSFSVPTAQIAGQLVSGKIAYAVVPEPFATVALMKSSKIVPAIDLQDEYKAINGENAQVPLTVMVARRDFAEAHADDLEKMLRDYEASYNWTIKHPAQAAKLCEKHNLGLSADVLSRAIPVSNYVFTPSEEAKPCVEEFLALLLSFSGDSVGGKLPEDDFYLFSLKSE